MVGSDCGIAGPIIRCTPLSSVGTLGRTYANGSQRVHVPPAARHIFGDLKVESKSRQVDLKHAVRGPSKTSIPLN